MSEGAGFDPDLISSDFKSEDQARNGRGGPRPGSGRPPGSVNKTTAEIRVLAGAWGPAAVEKAARLAGLVVDDAGVPIGQALSEQVQLQALTMLLDRGYGKSATVLSGSDGGPAEISIDLTSKDPMDAARKVAFLLMRTVSATDRSSEATSHDH